MSESDDDMSYDDVCFDDFEVEETMILPKKSFVVLNDEEIRKRMHEDVSEVTSILSVQKEVACLLLLHYKFDVNALHEAWFASEEHVRKIVGLGDGNSIDDHVVERSVNCAVCFDDYGVDEVKGLSCRHFLCRACWKGYISCSVSDGPGCLFLKCPMPKCGVAIDEGFVSEFVSDAEKGKYEVYMVRLYVEAKRGMKWCPFPDCGNVVEFFGESGGYDVTCNCSHSFCWNCTQEHHRPVDCKTVERWTQKNHNESANTEWILAFTKSCPKCRRAIEKNHGCSHMTCGRPCGHEFCWLCLGNWRGHKGNCNQYKEGQAPVDAGEVTRQKAKMMLQRYMHYYERWASNNKSREKARSDLEKMQVGVLKVISEKNCQEEDVLSFIIEAWQQIIECRRVLKWTYAYGYYLPQGEDMKKKFFEYLQGEAEAGLERLHRCAENELEEYYKDGCSPAIDFLLFRSKLIGLTKVTATYFENLVTALENGLEDVGSHVAPATHETSQNNNMQITDV